MMVSPLYNSYNNRLVGVAPRKLADSNGHGFVLQTALTNKLGMAERKFVKR